jgi:glycosyltransferase involved in cell wall biosynthesis
MLTLRVAVPAPADARDRARRASVVVVHEHPPGPGRGDGVLATEVELLRERGHRVATFTAGTRESAPMGVPAAAARALRDGGDARRLRALLRRERPDVVHFHGTFPLLSAGMYGAARRRRAAVVQTLHDYRLVCPNALLFNEGSPCERCVGLGFGWPAVARGCYGGSRAATAVAAASSAAHRRAGARSVDLYLAPSDFARGRFVAGGLPRDRVAVRPDFLAADPGEGAHEGGFALYAGRLSAEKGVPTLIEAWQRIGTRLPLKVVGSGPLEGLRGMPGVEWLGTVPRDAVLRLMRDARLLVFPSERYETFPLTLVEAFAAGLPVLAADGGAAAGLVRRHAAGLVFPRGDAAALAGAVDAALARPAVLRGMGGAGRTAFLAHYTADRGYESLIEAYETAIHRAHRP